MVVREYRSGDEEALMRIWNRVVEDGVAFPEEEPFTLEEMPAFLAAQSFVGVAEADEQVLGMYILHPNGIGRKSHVANASYAVAVDARGRGVGKALVDHSLRMAKEKGYVSMQFNAVVKENLAAQHVYESAGFRKVGCIEKGFRMKDGSLSDMFIYYYPFWDEE